MIECFFFVEREDDEDGIVRALCLECKMNRLPKDFKAWFYSGQVGPWTVKCYNCGDVIHQHDEESENSHSA